MVSVEVGEKEVGGKVGRSVGGEGEKEGWRRGGEEEWGWGKVRM